MPQVGVIPARLSYVIGTVFARGRPRPTIGFCGLATVRHSGLEETRGRGAKWQTKSRLSLIPGKAVINGWLAIPSDVSAEMMARSAFIGILRTVA
jgi:hypothetical protein